MLLGHSIDVYRLVLGFISFKIIGEIMKNRFLTLTAFTILSSFILLSYRSTASICISGVNDNWQGTCGPQKNIFTEPAIEFRSSMRKLWENNIAFTRNFIVNTVADWNDNEKVMEKLIKNQDDIGNIIKPFYGEEAGKKLSFLLRNHILIAAQVINTNKIQSKSNSRLIAGMIPTSDLIAVNYAGEKNMKKWYANVDEIVSLLNGLNPNWSKSTLTHMLYKQLELTTQEVISRLQRDWNADIAAYDLGHTHMLMFADILSKGIINQFNYKFVP